MDGVKPMSNIHTSSVLILSDNFIFNQMLITPILVYDLLYLFCLNYVSGVYKYHNLLIEMEKMGLKYESEQKSKINHEYNKTHLAKKV